MATSEPRTDLEQPSNSAARPLACLLAVVAGLTRLFPYLWNFTPVGALGLFAGARLRAWHAFALPVGLMVLTDVLLWWKRGFDWDYSPVHVSRAFVYGSFLIYVLLGRMLRATESPWRIGAASLAGSLQFFLITNFGVWLLGIDNFSNPYPATLSGLLWCYAAGLPFYDLANPLGFFGYTLLGDLGFTVVLFGAYAWLTRTAFTAERVATPAENPAVG